MTSCFGQWFEWRCVVVFPVPFCAELFWMSPEALRLKVKGGQYRPTQTADIYSTAIILKEILCKNEAFQEETYVKHMTPKGKSCGPDLFIYLFIY